ncbi:MAG: hypothetical protein KJ607_14920, partial [Bacteroidetes bacterium]|nr:hypothetical protein [Bacteroidota bacterium]
MIFKKFFIPLLFFIVSLTVHAQGQKNTNFLFGVHLGGNITRYYVPGYSFKPDLLPTLGAGASKRLFGNFGLNACVEYAHKGSNNTSPYRKIRTHCIDGILAGQYMITPGIKLEAGLQSSYMITGYVLTISGSMPSGMRREMLGEENFGY